MSNQGKGGGKREGELERKNKLLFLTKFFLSFKPYESVTVYRNSK